ncbi:class II fructose-bisphosphate aldolase [Niallia circulans]|nr:class II fructose-bisphosphate aldolase [Niallia circulans]
MLLNMKQLLEVAQKHQFAVGAFNVADSNFLRVVVEEAESNNSPAIIAVHPTELDFVKDEFFAYVLSRIKNSHVPFVLHLDHGGNLDDIMRAIHVGFSSNLMSHFLTSFYQFFFSYIRMGNSRSARRYSNNIHPNPPPIKKYLSRFSLIINF